MHFFQQYIVDGISVQIKGINLLLLDVVLSHRSMGIDIKKLLKVFLFLVAFHSFCVGVGLIAIPFENFDFFGFVGYRGIFFKIQGGVFHIVMCGAYIPAALDPVKNESLMRFSIFAKFIATVFLLSYVFLAEMVLMVLFSGILDFIMGLILYWFYRNFRRVPG